MARAAIGGLEGVDKFLVGGTCGTFTMKPGKEVTREALAKAFEDGGLTLESFRTETRTRNVETVVVKGSGFD